jgi:classical protein kinase C
VPEPVQGETTRIWVSKIFMKCFDEWTSTDNFFPLILALSDLIKYETPHTTAKKSRMLHQIEFKLQIEKQYKMGIDKMVKLYQADGDRKSKNDAESKKVESASKIRLLQQSLKRYKQLHVMEESTEEETRE